MSNYHDSPMFGDDHGAMKFLPAMRVHPWRNLMMVGVLESVHLITVVKVVTARIGKPPDLESGSVGTRARMIQHRSLDLQ